MMKDVMKDHPGAIGAFLTEDEIDPVSKLLYNRFHYEYGVRPSYQDSDRVQIIMKRQVRQVLDALSLSGYKVVPMETDEKRFPIKPYTQMEKDAISKDLNGTRNPRPDTTGE